MSRRGRFVLVPASWVEHRFALLGARCARPDVDADRLFFGPGRNEALEEKRQREEAAKALCAECPALLACREAVDRIERSDGPQLGIWGGETPGERRRRQASEGCTASGSDPMVYRP